MCLVSCKMINQQSNMKLVYIPETELGECYYDPISHEGLMVISDKAVRITMSHNFNLREQGSIQEMEVDAAVFRTLLESSTKGGLSLREVRKAFRSVL